MLGEIGHQSRGHTVPLLQYLRKQAEQNFSVFTGEWELLFIAAPGPSHRGGLPYGGALALGARASAVAAREL